MIETEQTISIDAPIEAVWTYVRDIERWANLMPGLRECEVTDDNDSRWTLKVGVGGMVRTVKVLVHVDEWDGPERVSFSFKLDGDPVGGGGAYLATSKGPGETEVRLKVQVVGSGSMAPMWEAMGKPLLPQFAKAFAGQLKDEIEKAAATTAQPVATPTAPTASGDLGGWLRAVWRALFSPGKQQPTSSRRT
jgi:carbon monoxide dehydrogenase subunit G